MNVLDRATTISVRPTARSLERGILYLPKRFAKSFPRGSKLLKIKAFFGAANKVSELSYNPKYRVIWGLQEFYHRYKVQSGNAIVIESITPLRKYRFKVDKSAGLKESKKEIDIVKRSVVGEVINFRGLVYAPVNEQGVIFLFALVMNDLKMYLEEIRTSFPDAVGRRFDGKGWTRLNIEFEYRSSDYKLHNHPIKGCDLIVCWQHNWEECPIEVIELKSVIKKLSQK